MYVTKGCPRQPAFFSNHYMGVSAKESSAPDWHTHKGFIGQLSLLQMIRVSSED